MPHHSGEQDTLSVLLDGLAAGRSAVVTLTGRPGYGQNALARWTARLGRSRGLRVLSARAVPSESGLSHGAAAQLLSALDATFPDRFAPVLRAARRNPLLLVLEDAQWADPESLQWLHALVRRSATAPLIVLASGSDACALGPDWRSLAASSPDPGSSHELLLGPPSTSDAAHTVRTVCGVEGEPEFTVAALRVSAATPAVLHATLRQFARHGHLPVAPQVPQFEALGRAVLDDHIGRVLRGLPAETVAVLRALAVGGRVLDFRAVCVLAGVGHLREARLRAVLDATGFVRTTGSDVRIVAEVGLRVLAEMEPAERAALHAAAARLAHHAGTADQEVAGLLLHASALGAPWTVPALRRSCRAAQWEGDHTRAAAFLARALREPLDEKDNARLTLELAAAELVTAPEAGIRRLGELTRTRDGARSALRVCALDLGLAAGDADGMRRAAAEARPAVAEGEQEALSALFWAADPADREHAERIVPGMPPLPAHPAAVLQAGPRAWQLALAGDGLTTARDLARTALARPPYGAPFTPYLAACKALCLTGDRDEADAGLSTLLAVIRADGRWIAAAQVLAARAELNLRRGLLAAAEQDIGAAERALPQLSRHPAATARLRAVRIVVDLERGDSVRAGTLAAEPAPEAAHHSPYWPHLLFARAMVVAAADPVEAVHLLRECGRLLLHRGHVNPALLPWRSAAARILRATGQAAEAHRLGSEELRLARRWGAVGPVGWAELNAGPAAAHDDPARARYAAGLLGRGPAGPAYQRALADLAAAELTAGGSRQAAAAAVAELKVLTATHPQGPVARRARRLAAELAPGRSAGVAEPTAWAELSPPEARTATLAARGHSNTQIAELLSLSRRAVELRLSRVYRKLHIGSREELRALVRDMEGR
ncbi:LuxR C-terminal-related transcriptional regulator [Streptomyces sp. NBC_01343]|uniref:LuxR C-terminal-related transcriptional regulator n=1 Tax=Streptomyces sp. NBC_01343 TaxID=2903832 RepID=UPI002E135711|nr:LuxR C-terminal-related transcriptional regulator [Streptomyces sp. NBC_01343]